MTEDETFAALKKQPYSVVREMVRNTPDHEWNNLPFEEFNKRFSDLGWTYGEYHREYVRTPE
jgi:hypothetical protein